MMENFFVTKIIDLISPLSNETQLEILSELTKKIKFRILNSEDKGKDKIMLLKELNASWKDTGNDLADVLLSERLISDKSLK